MNDTVPSLGFEIPATLGAQAPAGGEGGQILLWTAIAFFVFLIVAGVIWYFTRNRHSLSSFQSDDGMITPTPLQKKNGHTVRLPPSRGGDSPVALDLSRREDGVVEAKFVSPAPAPAPAASASPTKIVPEMAIVNLKSVTISWVSAPSIMVFGLKTDHYGVRNLAFGLALPVIGQLLQYSATSRLYVGEDGKIIDRPSEIKTKKVVKLYLKPDLETIASLLLIARIGKGSSEIDRIMATLKLDPKDRSIRVPVWRQTTGKNTTQDYLQYERTEFDPNGGYAWRIVSVEENSLQRIENTSTPIAVAA